MYEDRKDNFSIRDIILQVLFVALFVFILMWLFPTKNFVTNYVKNNINDAVQEALEDYEFGGGINSEAFANQLFNQNVMMMKDGAKDYFTLERLPQETGDKVKLTLKQMLSEKIILPFVDSKGETCSLDDSYVLVTKTDTEYLMKINLKCSDYEDYLLVHMGCYDYCSTTICETKKPSEPVKGGDVTPDPTPDTPNPTPVVYEYKYQLVIDGKWGEFGEWSDWTTNIISKTDYRDVEVKTENEKTGERTETVQTGTTKEPIYEIQKVKVGTKTETVAVGTKQVPIYSTQTVQTGTRTESYPVTKTVSVPVTKTEQVQTGTRSETVTVNTTVTVPIYKDVRKTTLDCTNSCKQVITYERVKVGETTETRPVQKTIQVPVYTTRTYTVYESKQVTTTETRQVPVYETKQVQTGTRTETIYENKTVDVYEERKVQTGTKEVPVYGTKVVPVYTNVTYYRSRIREYINGTTDIKWSRSQNDLSLIKQGYTLTGESRVVE